MRSASVTSDLISKKIKIFLVGKCALANPGFRRLMTSFFPFCFNSDTLKIWVDKRNFHKIIEFRYLTEGENIHTFFTIQKKSRFQLSSSFWRQVFAKNKHGNLWPFLTWQFSHVHSVTVTNVKNCLIKSHYLQSFLTGF